MRANKSPSITVNQNQLATVNQSVLMKANDSQSDAMNQNQLIAIKNKLILVVNMSGLPSGTYTYIPEHNIPDVHILCWCILL